MVDSLCKRVFLRLIGFFGQLYGADYVIENLRRICVSNSGTLSVRNFRGIELQGFEMCVNVLMVLGSTSVRAEMNGDNRYGEPASTNVKK